MDAFSKYKTEEIDAIANEEDNKKCFQCQTSPANWICVFNGIFLCASCAGEHRSFGTRISSIKSLILDKLNPFQIETMKVGGNAKAKALLEAKWKDYKEYEKIVVFSSKLMEYHRNYLYDTIVGNTIQPEIDANEIREIMEKTSLIQRPLLTEVPIKPVVIEPKEEIKDDNKENDEAGNTNEEENDNKEQEGKEENKEENEVKEEDNDKVEDGVQEEQEEEEPETEEERIKREEERKIREEEERKKKEMEDKITITKEVSDEPFMKTEQPAEESSKPGKYRVAEGKTKEKSDCSLQ